tara:strand:- start:206 stop:1003 length:798 start_codon:yes stop_codon:yes gene_type:complete
MYDKKIIMLSRNRVARNYNKFNFLKLHSSEVIKKNIQNINKDFDRVLEIGSHDGGLTAKLKKLKKIKKIISIDNSIEMIKLNRISNNYFINVDEESLIFKNDSFDGVFSCLYLNNLNDYEIFFNNINKILKKKGVFLFSIFGSETIRELKSTLIKTDEIVFNGVYPRFNMQFDVKGLGNFLLNLGFKNTVIETDLIKVKYKSTLKLMRDLKGMGESNFLKKRRKYFSNKFFFSTLEKQYKLNYYDNKDHTIYSTFEIITAVCWKE